MTSLKIEDSSIPSLTGKVAVITGGASGIGYATAKILAAHEAQVYILDINAPKDPSIPSLINYMRCNVTAWADLSRNFLDIGHIDMVFANAGILDTEPFPQELTFDGDMTPLEPTYSVLDVNMKASLNVIQLSWHIMKRQSEGGSIVLTASFSGYGPVIGLPLYSASKAALINLVRSLHPLTIAANITINAVAPSIVATPLLPQALIDALAAAHIPVSAADDAGLALVYSATAKQTETSGPEMDGAKDGVESRWNGKVIVTLGDRYMEVEEPIADARPVWLGEEATRVIGAQLDAMDSRGKK